MRRKRRKKIGTMWMWESKEETYESGWLWRVPGTKLLASFVTSCSHSRPVVLGPRFILNELK
jgi:hypothetical protein